MLVFNFLALEIDIFPRATNTLPTLHPRVNDTLSTGSTNSIRMIITCHRHLHILRLWQRHQTLQLSTTEAMLPLITILPCATMSLSPLPMRLHRHSHGRCLSRSGTQPQKVSVYAGLHFASSWLMESPQPTEAHLRETALGAVAVVATNTLNGSHRTDTAEMASTTKAQLPAPLVSLLAGALQKATSARNSTLVQVLAAALLTLPHLRLRAIPRRHLLPRTTARPRLAIETCICDLLDTNRGQDTIATMDIMGLCTELADGEDG